MRHLTAISPRTMTTGKQRHVPFLQLTKTGGRFTLRTQTPELETLLPPTLEVLGPWRKILQGAVFHQWLTTHSLVAPQTFEEHHQGQRFTWTHANGEHQARLDYILVDSDLYSNEIRTESPCLHHHQCTLTLHQLFLGRLMYILMQLRSSNG